jgi:tetratricopeptide (TPR) repeat protein
MQGELLLSERRIPEAETALRKAVANDPTDLKAHRMLANLYKLQGESKLATQHEELAEAMEKARKSGDPVATEMAMVRLLLKSDKEDLARERVEALKKNHPRDWRGPFLEGLMAKSLGNLNQAMTLFKSARRMDVNAPEPHIEIARIHSKMDDMIGAVSEARQAVALSPRDPEVRIALAEILRAHGYMDQAIEEEELAESLAKRNHK